jgi:hypothetical protein
MGKLLMYNCSSGIKAKAIKSAISKKIRWIIKNRNIANISL